MSQHDLLSLLFAMYEQAREGGPAQPPSLATRAGLRPEAVAEGLRRLALRGLVDAERRRLSLRGFAVAHALCAQVAAERRAHAA